MITEQMIELIKKMTKQAEEAIKEIVIKYEEETGLHVEDIIYVTLPVSVIGEKKLQDIIQVTLKITL